jgi:hypothetical protein
MSFLKMIIKSAALIQTEFTNGIQIRSKKAPVNFSWWLEYYFASDRDIIILVA